MCDHYCCTFLSIRVSIASANCLKSEGASVFVVTYKTHVTKGRKKILFGKDNVFKMMQKRKPGKVQIQF